MELEFGGGHISVTGAIHYSSGVKRSKVVGLLLHVGINEYPAEVIVDTGAPFLVCTPQLAQAMGVEDLVPLLRANILYRGIWLEGNIYTLTVAFAADDNMGTGISLRVQGFVPDVVDILDDILPFSSLGWISCLESIPFAISRQAGLLLLLRKTHEGL